tara:strand:+ start:906 stop:1085 length:180 start_codon:yes stop_codon:yes gene_type:complete
MASFEQFRQSMPEQAPIFKVIQNSRKPDDLAEDSIINAIDIVIKDLDDEMVEDGEHQPE